MARAVAECEGNRTLVEGLYIKFRVQELMNECKMIEERHGREQGFMLCPRCGHYAKPLRKSRGDWGVFLVLLFLFVVPGIIYFFLMEGYKGICEKCGRTLLQRC